MNRIHIFGASGSGVTTLGVALGEKLKIRYFDSDDYFWENSTIPFSKKREPDLRNREIKQILNSHQEWIFGGSSWNWGKDVFPAYSLVVFLQIPKEIRLQRLEKRESLRYGDAISPDSEQAKKTKEFLLWAADYDDCTGIANRTIQVHENWLKEIPYPTLRIEGDYSVKERINIILDFLKKK